MLHLLYRFTQIISFNHTRITSMHTKSTDGEKFGLTLCLDNVNVVNVDS